MKKTTNIIVLVGFLSFIVSFFLPALWITNELIMSGFTAFLVNLGMLFYVENNTEYFLFVFLMMPNIWAPFLFIRYWRPESNKYITLIISSITLAATIYWPFSFEDASVLLIGYWLWLMGIVLIVSAVVMKRKDLQ